MSGRGGWRSKNSSKVDEAVVAISLLVNKVIYIFVAQYCVVKKD